MSGTETQKQLLSLIRDFASEKSQRERQLVGLKKRIEELRSELEEAISALEDAKRFKEDTEQELKGYEVELALNEASIHALETRNAMIQDEISAVGNEVEALKNEEGSQRDRFISQMLELNKAIRKFHSTLPSGVGKDDSLAVLEATEEANDKVTKYSDKTSTRCLDDMLADIASQIAKEEEEYLAEQTRQKKVEKGLMDYGRKATLMESIIKETKALQDLTRQTSELEEACASMGEELQKRCVCPRCHMENLEALSELLQGNEAS